VKIDANNRGKLPQVPDPEPFHDAKSGLHGWKVRLPGGRPLATPAVVEGRVFLGGGFGSYEFYGLDADSGRVAWQYQTEDDGPTAAVVADGKVVFNTESCELEVLTIEGRPVWKHWLGDPLLSMPAIEAGRVYMAFPDRRDRRHYLACFDLTDGRELWRQPTIGEIITCPVLADGHVYVSNLDGTLACFEQMSGQPLWQEARNATSAPAVWRSQCYFSQRREVPPGAGATEVQQTEHLARKLSAAGTHPEMFASTSRHADYLDHAKRSRRSPHYSSHSLHDSAVGFSGHKGDAKIYQAMSNLGTGQVYGVWSYQGSKPFVERGRLYSGLGDTVHCADPESSEVFWKKKLRDGDDDAELLDSLLTPPALTNGKLFLGTLDGRVLCLSAARGDVLWSVSIGEPVLLQPAVARGRVYVPTGAGTLFCLETGDPDDDGWLMWGATPAHNGLHADPVG
jgi:outer membrane protein assembly factor BamB